MTKSVHISAGVFISQIEQDFAVECNATAATKSRSGAEVSVPA
jgi:hypothetical protein